MRQDGVGAYQHRISSGDRVLKDSIARIDARMNEDRIYQDADDFWYFKIRGKMVKGPFATLREAESALAAHISKCCHPLGNSFWSKPLRAWKSARSDTTEPGRT